MLSLDELFLEGVHRMLDERGPVIRRSGRWTSGGRPFMAWSSRFFTSRITWRAFAPVADDGRCRRRFAVAVQFRDAAAHVGPSWIVRHFAEQDGHAVGADADGDFSSGHRGSRRSAHADDEFLLRHFERAPPTSPLLRWNGHADVGDGQVVSAQFRGVHGDLVLLDEAADGPRLRRRPRRS